MIEGWVYIQFLSTPQDHQTPLDYFLFGHLYNTIFKTPIHTMKRLPIYVYSRMGAISNSFFH